MRKLSTQSTSPPLHPSLPSVHLCPRRNYISKTSCLSIPPPIFLPSCLENSLTYQSQTQRKGLQSTYGSFLAPEPWQVFKALSNHTTICNSKGGGSNLRCNRAAVEFTCIQDVNHGSLSRAILSYTDSSATVVPDQSFWRISSINLREET